MIESCGRKSPWKAWSTPRPGKKANSVGIEADSHLGDSECKLSVGQLEIGLADALGKPIMVRDTLKKRFGRLAR